MVLIWTQQVLKRKPKPKTKQPNPNICWSTADRGRSSFFPCIVNTIFVTFGLEFTVPNLSPVVQSLLTYSKYCSFAFTLSCDCGFLLASCIPFAQDYALNKAKSIVLHIRYQRGHLSHLTVTDRLSSKHNTTMSWIFLQYLAFALSSFWLESSLTVHLCLCALEQSLDASL